MDPTQKKQTRQLLTRLRPPRRNPLDAWTAESPEEEKYATEIGVRRATPKYFDQVSEQQDIVPASVFRSQLGPELRPEEQGMSEDPYEPAVPYSREYVDKLSGAGEEEVELPPASDEEETGIMSLRRRQPRKKGGKK